MKNRFPPTQEDPAFVWFKYFAYILAKYGITEGQWREAWKKQKGKCAICRKKVAVITDHDHKTGKFRGLLCFFCNGLLGKFEKYRNRIIPYLQRG